MRTNIYLCALLIGFIVIAALFTGCKSPANKPGNVIAPMANDTASAKHPVKTTTDTAEVQTALTLTINKLTSDTANIIVGVYGTKNKFPDPNDQLKEYIFKPHGKRCVAKITNLPFGTYALAIYQDENGNGKIDKNLLGIPTEVYAFSNNYKPIIKAPTFNNCRFNYSAGANTLNINMLK